jgi:hypothetical protein
VARTAKKTVAKKAAAAKRPPRRSGTAPDGAAGAAAGAAGAVATPAGSYRARVRMYRQGLGDCFLISLPRTDGSSRPFYVMIDCGVVLGTSDPGTIMKQVLDNIAEVTGGEIDLLIATHEHWDHLSGFVQAKESFDKLTKVGQVWLAWTENPEDELTQKLKKEKGQALAALRMGLSQMQAAGDPAGAAELNGILEFFGAAKGPTTADALNNVRAKTAKPRYCLPTDPPVQPAGTNARFYVLGPPHDEKMLRKINPSASNKETYGLALDSFPLFMDGAGTAFGDAGDGHPFDQQYEIPFAYAQSAPELGFFRQHYWQPGQAAPDAWRRIDTDWLGGASDLALQLDSLTNNTSLVIAIELPGGDVLLFAADAQVGNWLSWQDRSWTVDGKTVTGPDLLKNAIFYKVGHHGSHNATLRAQGLEEMVRLRVAMIPVDHDMAVKKRWAKMPLDELVTALGQRAKGCVLRVDQPKPPTQENVVEEKLFFEVTF